jgi:hypothetical protein
MSVRTRLVLALLAGPVAAAADMTVLYVLVYRAQATGSKLPLHIATVAFLGVALFGAVYAFREMHQERVRAERFLATLGAVLGAFFALVILSFEVPASILRPWD